MMSEETPSEDLQPDAQEAPDSAVESEDTQSLTDTQTADSVESDSPEATDDALPEEVAEPDSSEVGLEQINSPDEIDALLDQWEQKGEVEEPEPEPEPESEPEPETEEVKETEDESPPPLADEVEEQVEDKTKPVRRRLVAQNELENEFVSVKQRNPDMTIEDALAIARNNLGIEPPAPATPEAKEATEENEPEQVEEGPATSKDARDLADQVAAEHKKALIDLDFEKAAELSDQLRTLDRRTVELEQQEAEAMVMAEKSFNDQFDADQEKAIAMYPEAATPNSKFAERMREIDQSLKETGNDLYYSSNKVSKIAMMAANELGISPSREGKAASPPVTKKVSSSPPKKAPVPPPTASGGAKTTIQSDSERQDADQAAIAAINSPQAMEDFLDKAMGGTY